VEIDEAQYVLTPSTVFADRWDLRCERRVELRQGARLKRYVEFVRARPTILGARVRRRDGRHVELATNGVTRYEVSGALARTPASAARVHGSLTAFEWVGLLCRYGAARATLRLSRTNAEGLEPFGSVTDLTIGRERPVRISAADDHWMLTAGSCAARSLLRIYWPIAKPTGGA
jgi:hypothetical protein